MDKYYRQLKSVKDNVDNSLKIASMLLNISSNSTNIEDNEDTISSNLNKIGTNEADISYTLEKIGTNETNISSNLIELNNIKNDMIIKVRKDIFDETHTISNMFTNYNNKK